MKWGEIEEQLREEKLMVYGFVETHLRDMEQPPSNPDYAWEYCNRTEGSKKGGGIGAFIHKSTDWQRVKQECREHLWLKGKVAGQMTLLGFVYLWTGAKAREENQEMVQCIEKDIDELGEECEIIILGDMNAHIADMDGYTDPTGRMLMDMCERHDLIICNSTEKCEGQITWEVGRLQSTIDYALMSRRMYDRLRVMNIDEYGSRSLGSDHKRIKLSFAREMKIGRRQHEQPQGNIYSERQIEIATKEIEKVITEDTKTVWTYTNLTRLFELELAKVRVKSTGKRRHKPKSWWDEEVKRAIVRRQEASREHRHAKQRGEPEDDVERKWGNFLSCRREASNLINEKIRRKGAQWMAEVNKKDRKAAAKFWNHLNSLSSKTSMEQRFITTAQGVRLEGDEAMEFIRTTMTEKFKQQGSDACTLTDEDRPISAVAPLGQREWERAGKRVPNSTSTGPDGIPIMLIKKLGPNSKQTLREAASKAIMDGEAPPGWKLSRMSMIYKGKGDKADINNYRPITVTSVVYRLVMQIVKERLQTWVENEGVLGELQNGFRKRRRLEDNLFSLTQCIEIAEKEHRPLWLAFLDIKGAYDSVIQEDLWGILDTLDVEDGITNLLKDIYKSNKVVIKWEKQVSKPIEIQRGLRQGCPLSPLLFMLYLQGLEAKLEGSRLGFSLSFAKQGKHVEQSLPALMYADDIVLMADNKEDLQGLIDICGKEGDRLNLKFSREKSAIMILNDNEGSEHKIQEVTLEIVDKYKYLGVWINNGAEYLREHERYVMTKGNRNAAVMKNRALWNYNRYDVVRGIWKGVMVPGLTFGNAVLCMRSEVQARLEIKQRGIGRLALGAHGNTPNQGVQGDMGWTSFEGREASSKIEFEERLRKMGEERWARKVFSYLYMKNVDTKWRKRTRKLSSKYLDNSRIPSQKETSVKKKVKETERDMWKVGMLTKSSLETYRTFKQEIAKEKIYDNSRGSSLLFEARTGVLRTKTYRAKYEGTDTLCSACGEEEETAEHLIMFCKGLHPTVQDNGAEFFKALGFRDSEGKIDFKRVEITRRRLTDWWLQSRHE